MKVSLDDPNIWKKMFQTTSQFNSDGLVGMKKIDFSGHFMVI